MQLPDYQGRSIVNLMASLQAGLRGGAHAYPPLAALPPDRVAAHQRVLLWVIDGLGLNYLRAHAEAAALNAHLCAGITSVFPPTTASAITTFVTGDAPQQHGLTGWHMYFRELGSVLAVLPARPRLGGATLSAAGVDLDALLGHRAFADRIGVASHTVAPQAIADSDFSVAHRGRAALAAFADLDGLVAACIECLRADGERFVYAYWSELDALGHRVGMHSEAAHDHLLELDRAFAELLDGLRGTGTLVIVCADHGQIDAPLQRRIDLDDHAELRDCLVLPLCGELRAAYCYLRPGSEERFDGYVADVFGDALYNMPAARAIADGWFGLGDPHPRLAERIGDRILLLRDDYTIKDWLPHERRFDMVGVHGGLSDDERLVPLVVAAC